MHATSQSVNNYRNGPRQRVLSLSTSIALIALAAAGNSASGEEQSRKSLSRGIVVSVSSDASEAGVVILRKGGNAVDAAVATAFALAVTYPQAGNIGGGGFMMVHPAPGREPVVIEYREKAPDAATVDMFAKGRSPYGHKVVGVPGTVRGLALAHKQFGKLPWKDLLQPAIKLASEGFILNENLANSINWIVNERREFSELRRVYGKNGGKERWNAGDTIVLSDLAGTLRVLADQGPDAFYHGPIADSIVSEMAAGGGLIGRADLAKYTARLRKPIHGTYRGYDVYAPPPPSSGGICLVAMLNILENYDLPSLGRWTPRTLHIMTEAMRRAFCDRARYLGDTDFIKIPDHLTSKEYSRRLAAGIDLERPTASARLAPELRIEVEPNSTTHFSIIDRNGMAVANTYTLEHSYGSCVVVRGAGFLLNNEMMDFNPRPGHTDDKGTIGTPPNLIAPGKRMLSSQTPTIVLRNGKTALVTGSPGSRTIINTVLCVTLNVIDFDMDIRKAVDAPRLHHSWFPDVVRFEGVSQHAASVQALRRMGHKVQGTVQGDAHSIWLNPKTGEYVGAADRRIAGNSAVE